jgi:hypothetical protein
VLSESFGNDHDWYGRVEPRDSSMACVGEQCWCGAIGYSAAAQCYWKHACDLTELLLRVTQVWQGSEKSLGTWPNIEADEFTPSVFVEACARPPPEIRVEATRPRAAAWTVVEKAARNCGKGRSCLEPLSSSNRYAVLSAEDMSSAGEVAGTDVEPTLSCAEAPGSRATVLSCRDSSSGSFAVGVSHVTGAAGVGAVQTRTVGTLGFGKMRRGRKHTTVLSDEDSRSGGCQTSAVEPPLSCLVELGSCATVLSDEESHIGGRCSEDIVVQKDDVGTGHAVLGDDSTLEEFAAAKAEALASFRENVRARRQALVLLQVFLEQHCETVREAEASFGRSELLSSQTAAETTERQRVLDTYLGASDLELAGMGWPPPLT